MAILQRGGRRYEDLVYLHRSTRNKKQLVYRGHVYRKTSESLDTDVEYRRALRQKKKCEETGSCSVVWTGERVSEGRIYGTFVRRYPRRK